MRRSNRPPKDFFWPEAQLRKQPQDREWLPWLLGAAAVAIIIAAGIVIADARDLTLPDPALTPGVTTAMSVEDICAKKWGKDRRNVTSAMKRQVFESYGLKGNVAVEWCRKDKHGRVFEIDHSCSRENGGADAIGNLWAQCYSGEWNAVMKDRLENALHRSLCAGEMTLGDVQAELCLNGADWRESYKKHFGEPK